MAKQDLNNLFDPLAKLKADLNLPEVSYGYSSYDGYHLVKNGKDYNLGFDRDLAEQLAKQQIKPAKEFKPRSNKGNDPPEIDFPLTQVEKVDYKPSGKLELKPVPAGVRIELTKDGYFKGARTFGITENFGKVLNNQGVIYSTMRDEHQQLANNQKLILETTQEGFTAVTENQKRLSENQKKILASIAAVETAVGVGFYQIQQEFNTLMMIMVAMFIIILIAIGLLFYFMNKQDQEVKRLIYQKTRGGAQ
jgi:hypothetical protein